MESLNRIVIKKHEINRAFLILNLILDGQFSKWKTSPTCVNGVKCFKPYFKWSAPYTLADELWQMNKDEKF